MLIPPKMDHLKMYPPNTYVVSHYAAKQSEAHPNGSTPNSTHLK